ncbi:MAG: single-stranded DNA-specific DHH superfamily exonuclease [Candidatus Woesearchaeota archaeon]|jgi:single-stranded DNA-specific DHH superfamily exonuclease
MVLPLLQKIRDLTRGKHLHIATHWDCDGVATGGLLYHILKDGPSKITTTSRGEVFLVQPHDVPPEADIIICSDIQPSVELDPNKVIYIDHHPHEQSDNYLLAIHDIEIQSCSLLIWEKLLKDDTYDPYLLFLTLMGYFGDSGPIRNIPVELELRAKEAFPHLMVPRESRFSSEPYLGIQMFVSLFNTGKRMHWNGQIPLELVKSVTQYQDITMNRHPLVDELQRYKLELRKLYEKKYTLIDTEHLQYSIIECDKNIQGVICSRYMKDKPVIVLNTRKGIIIASMRVPDHLDFDAGAFLAQFKKKAPNVVGGGHEKAGGITFDPIHLDIFIDHLNDTKLTCPNS